jgi:hypothetical protein
MNTLTSWVASTTRELMRESLHLFDAVASLKTAAMSCRLLVFAKKRLHSFQHSK